MLTVHDTRTGTPTPVSTDAVVTVVVAVGDPSPAGEWTAVRALLVADTLRRVLEDLHAARVAVAVVGPADDLAERVRGWGEAVSLRPAAGVFPTLAAAATALCRPIRITVTTDAAATGDPDTAGSVTLSVAPAHAEVAVAGIADAGPLRWVLLSRHYRTPVRVEESLPARAVDAVAGWRERLADYSHAPGGAIPRGWQQRVRVAADTDLDTPAVLGLVETLVDDTEVAEGAKFEALAWCDRILALDLACDLGRVRR